MRSPCLLVPRGEAESVRRRLRQEGLLRLDLKVRRLGNAVLLPVVNPVDYGFPIREEEFEVQGNPRVDYRALAEVPQEVKAQLPSSFDVLGDVAIIKLPDGLLPWGDAIGWAMLKAHPRLRSAALDEGVQGEFRIRRLRVLAGKTSLATVHREYGLSFALDPSRVYFSPRLATERMRVAREVKPGEVVVDMFAGVGPFALMVARFGRPSKVYAIDANPEAFPLLEENIRRNREEHLVVPVMGDARQVVPTLGKVDRVIMDLPHSALDFLEVALGALAEGGFVHYYEIMPRSGLEEREAGLRRRAMEAGRGLEIIGVREVRGYSPTEFHFALDLRVT